MKPLENWKCLSGSSKMEKSWTQKHFLYLANLKKEALIQEALDHKTWYLGFPCHIYAMIFGEDFKKIKKVEVLNTCLDNEWPINVILGVKQSRSVLCFVDQVSFLNNMHI